MSEARSLLVYLRDPRLAPHVTAETPAWLWSADAARILWGNPAAAAIFNAASPAALAGHTIDPKGSAALQMARLAGTLPHGAPPRLERLRGFGGRFGGALLCGCSRIMLTDRTPAILVIATEVAGPHLSLEERARRLLVGCDEAVALFSADGALLQATPAAQQRLGRGRTLTALGAGPLASLALAGGHAAGEHGDGQIVLDRIGHGAATLLLAAFEAQPVDDAKPAERPALPPDAAAAVTAEPPRRRLKRSRRPRRCLLRRQPRGGSRCASSGRWTPKAASRSIPKISRASPDPPPRKRSASPGARSATVLGLDPEGQVAGALASRDTWSGITIDLPVDGTDEAICGRVFRPAGVRSRTPFPRLSRLRRLPRRRAHEPRLLRQRAPSGQSAGTAASRRADAFKPEPPALTVVPQSENVVPFRASGAAGLSPGDATPDRAGRSHSRAPKPPRPPRRARFQRRRWPRTRAEPPAEMTARAGMPSRKDRCRRARLRSAETRRRIFPAARRPRGPRPDADRRPGLSARPAALRQRRVPGMERLRI